MSEAQISLGAGHAAAMEPSPYGIQSKKLTMWLFIISDAVTFGAILFGYAYLRIGSPNWPTPFEFSPSIINGLVMTFVLLSSSLSMLAAVSAAKQGRKSSTLKWLSVTIILGIIFATLHLREWFHMFGEGWSLSKNPLGGSVQFGATFFSITGLHLIHVISGVIALIVIAIGYNTEWLDAGHVETTGLYWHFVDLVWMFVFPLLYLMNVGH
ncbi:MAG: cytochrome c oxidase subunit 3 [Candidatus Acidiferrales bacterium]